MDGDRRLGVVSFPQPKLIPGWRGQAHCAGSEWEVWTKDTSRNTDTWELNAALRMCAECPVWATCLEEALLNNDIGIRGGLLEEDRKYFNRPRSDKSYQRVQAVRRRRENEKAYR